MILAATAGGVHFLLLISSFALWILDSPILSLIAGGGSYLCSLGSFSYYFGDKIGNVTALRSVFLHGAGTLVVFANIHVSIGIEPCLTGSVIEKFLGGLYFSIVTFTTLGYGDYKPVKDGQLLAAFQALLGYIYLGLLIGMVIHRASLNTVTPRDKP